MENINNVPEDEVEIDLRELFFVLLSRIWTIIICAVVGVVIAGAVTTLAITPIYSSTSMIYIKSGTDLSSLSLTDLQMSSALTDDYVVLIKSRPVVNKVINNLELDMTYGQLAANISTVNQSGTHIINVTVSNEDPYVAKTIVDELTTVAVARTAEIMSTNEPKIIEEGTVNEAPVSPDLKKNVLIGGAVGVLLSVIVIVILYLMDDSIRTAEDVEKYLGLETLGTIPMEEGKSKKAERKKEAKKQKARMKEKRRSAGKGVS